MSEHEQNLSAEAQEPTAEEVVLPPLTPQPEPAAASPEPEAEVAPAGPEAAEVAPAEPEAAEVAPAGPEAAEVAPAEPEAAEVAPAEPEAAEADAVSEPAAEAAPAETEAAEADAVSEPAAEAAPAEPEAAEADAVSEPAAEAAPAEPEAAEADAVSEPAAEAAPAEPEAKEPAPEEAGVVDQAAEEQEVFKRPRTIRDIKKGMVLEGKVTSVAIYGAFVDIGVGREGLVHISQLSDQSVSSPTEVVQIGDMVTVRVLDVDPRSRRISLTMRERVEPKVDREQLKALTPGTVLDGTVTSLTRFGAFVDVGVGRDGLVPLSQMGLRDEQQASDVLQVGEPVRVRVLDVDQKRSRIRLSMRNIYDEEVLAALQPGAIVRGRVTGMAAFGAFVDVGVGKDGLVHVSELGEESVGHPREVLKVGQEVEVRVVEVDADTQRISLSLQLEEEEEWVPDWQEEAGEEEALPEQATLEDLLTHFSSMRPSGRSEEMAGASQAEKEKRALREAQQRTLEELRQQEE